MSTRLWDALRAQWVWSRKQQSAVGLSRLQKYMKFVRSLGLKQAKIALHDVLNFALPNLGNQIGRWERDWHTDSHIDPILANLSDNPKEPNYLSNFGIQLGKFSRFFTEESSSKKTFRPPVRMAQFERSFQTSEFLATLLPLRLSDFAYPAYQALNPSPIRTAPNSNKISIHLFEPLFACLLKAYEPRRVSSPRSLCRAGLSAERTATSLEERHSFYLTNRWTTSERPHPLIFLFNSFYECVHKAFLQEWLRRALFLLLAWSSHSSAVKLKVARNSFCTLNRK